ncbi:hypothetical protein PMAYCL1PPCAC_32384, partial [Pristionchus mayeri]
RVQTKEQSEHKSEREHPQNNVHHLVNSHPLLCLQEPANEHADNIHLATCNRREVHQEHII